MQVDYAFNVNDVRFNSGLNADVMQVLENNGNEFDLVQPFVADYEMNHRQLAIYVIDCDVIACDGINTQKFDKVSNLIKETPITLFFMDERRPLDPHALAKRIDQLIQATIERRKTDLLPEEGREISFIASPLQELDSQLEKFVFPEIAKFKRALIGFQFKSPLNFIMLGNDFHDFFGMFYHAKLLTQYLTNFITDSVFSLHQLHVASLKEGEEIKKHDYEVKHAAAVAMRNSLSFKITQAVEVLVEYDYLLAAD